MKYIQNIENEAEAIKQKYDVLYYIKPLGSINLITAPRYTAVDLGLPSGRLWANMNIGAEKETDYGLYFQWGDTVGYYKNEIGKGEGQKNWKNKRESWQYLLSTLFADGL